MKARRETRAIELPHSWTPEELASIEDDIVAERPRGATPRFWEDVEGGVELDANTKGPIGLSDEIAFVASGAAPIPPTLLNRSIPCTTTITRHACRALKRSWATSRLPV